MHVAVFRKTGFAPQSKWMMSDATHPEGASPSADLALVERVIDGDRDALVDIHDRYHPLIFRYVSLQVADPDVAADLTSEVFVRFLEAIDGDRPPRATLQGWLFGVAKNVVRSHYRTAYRHPEVELDERLAGFGPGPAPDADVETAVDHDAARAALAGAMAALTEEQRQVIALRYGAELPIVETARAMGRSEGAVKQLQARAVAALARQMTRRTVSE